MESAKRGKTKRSKSVEFEKLINKEKEIVTEFVDMDIKKDNMLNFSDSQIVSHVKGALTAVESGDSSSYNELVGILYHNKHLTPNDVALLETTLRTLASAVSSIHITHHHSLLSAIFGMSLWNYAPHLADALADLIVSLAVSNGTYLDLCLCMLVANFIAPENYFSDERKCHVLRRVHAAFKKITDCVPLAPWALSSIVVQKMPTIYHKDRAVMMYVENMLKLESSEIGEFVGSKMLMAVVDWLIQLDVQIGWDANDGFSKGVFEMDLEDMAVDRNVELLDNLLVLTFQHLESCERAGRLVEVFEALLQSFRLTVMTTYKPKFTQFVMFYGCGLDPENCGMKFATLLADLFFQDSLPQRTRMSAVGYLASFLSRANFLSGTRLSSTLQRLVDWCLEYCRNHDSDVINPNGHEVFYSGCQAIVYVLCFRLKMFVLKLHILSPLEQILKHKLNPLKACIPSVVEEFLRQSKAARLFTMLETFTHDGLLESERPDTFFSFDPCLLRRCDSFIRPMYIFWSMVNPIYDDDDYDEDISGDENEDQLDIDGFDSSI